MGQGQAHRCLRRSHQGALATAWEVQGWFVGIHTGQGRVALVDEDGVNVLALEGGQAVNLTLSGDDVAEWAPVLERGELPPGRAVSADAKLLP